MRKAIPNRRPKVTRMRTIRNTIYNPVPTRYSSDHAACTSAFATGLPTARSASALSLEGEEEHIDRLELVEKVGLQNYIQSQM